MFGRNACFAVVLIAALAMLCDPAVARPSSGHRPPQPPHNGTNGSHPYPPPQPQPPHNGTNGSHPYPPPQPQPPHNGTNGSYPYPPPQPQPPHNGTNGSHPYPPPQPQPPHNGTNGSHPYPPPQPQPPHNGTNGSHPYPPPQPQPPHNGTNGSYPYPQPQPQPPHNGTNGSYPYSRNSQHPNRPQHSNHECERDTDCVNSLGGGCLSQCEENKCVLSNFDICNSQTASVISIDLDRPINALQIIKIRQTIFNLLDIPPSSVVFLEQDRSSGALVFEFLSSSEMSASDAAQKLFVLVSQQDSFVRRSELRDASVAILKA